MSEAGIMVTEETVRKWARDRQIKTVVLPSGRYRFRPGDIDAITAQIDVT